MPETGKCANCGEALREKGAHATGPQAFKFTCALNPYGKFMATPAARPPEDRAEPTTAEQED